jgi:hypothetical protein
MKYYRFSHHKEQPADINKLNDQIVITFKDRRYPLFVDSIRLHKHHAFVELANGKKKGDGIFIDLENIKSIIVPNQKEKENDCKW